jgi:hypothetical protein
MAWQKAHFVDFGQITVSKAMTQAPCFGLKPEVSLAPLAVLAVTARTIPAIQQKTASPRATLRSSHT